MQSFKISELKSNIQWYQDASTKSLEEGYPVMDMAIDNIKQIVNKCWDNGIYPIITTLTPRRDITADGKVLFDYFNKWIKDYATEQSNNGKECAYVDFFNAGKDFDPPEPLGDPLDEYKLNPLYDGDNYIDANGNTHSGLGVHMNVDGYRVMGYAIPLSLFQTASTGIKLYTDSSCMFEERYNDEQATNPFYELTVPNVRLGIEKDVIRYIKNIGTIQTLYYIYINNTENLSYYFVDSDGNKSTTLCGILAPEQSRSIRLVIEPEFEDYESYFEMHIVARELSIGVS